ncbi:MAG: hypothetical protein LBJ71_02945, partial [Holosporaceae bacterium]|nr:hypothetical protein [Holosporaceae bacterium]
AIKANGAQLDNRTFFPTFTICWESNSLIGLVPFRFAVPVLLAPLALQGEQPELYRLSEERFP